MRLKDIDPEWVGQMLWEAYRDCWDKELKCCDSGRLRIAVAVGLNTRRCGRLITNAAGYPQAVDSFVSNVMAWSNWKRRVNKSSVVRCAEFLLQSVDLQNPDPARIETA